MRWRPAYTWILSLLLAAGLLYLFFAKADFKTVLHETREAAPGWVAAAVLLEVLSILLRAFRWGVMLKSVKEHVPYAPLLKATVVSFTMSGLVPGRLGEVAKPYLLSRWEKLPFGPLMVSVVLERGMDLVALVVLWFTFLFLGMSGVSPESGTVMRVFTDLSYVLLAFALPLGAFLLWLVPRRRVLDRGARRSERLRRHPLLLRILRSLLRFAEGLGTFQKKRMIVYVTFLSVVIWSLIAASSWALIQALHLGLPWGAAILLLMFICFGAAIPTPGGIGGVHKAIQLALVSIYGVTDDMGVTAGIVGHAVMFFPGILWGLGYLALGRVHLKELRQVSRESRRAEEAEEA